MGLLWFTIRMTNVGGLLIFAFAGRALCTFYLQFWGVTCTFYTIFLLGKSYREGNEIECRWWFNCCNLNLVLILFVHCCRWQWVLVRNCIDNPANTTFSQCWFYVWPPSTNARPALIQQWLNVWCLHWYKDRLKWWRLTRNRTCA